VSEQEQRGRAKKKLTDEVLQARASIQSILDELKADKTVFKAKQTKQRLAEIEEQARRSLIPPQETIPLERLQSGDSVEIVSLGTAGTLLESPQGKRRVRVRVGDADLSVSSSLLVGRPESTDTKRSPSRRPWPSMRASSASSLAETEAAFVDVRGKTADEALDLTVSALDRASLAGSPFLRIIHGHGTGKLRASLRSYLTESPYVASFRPGERPEGGDGVTIVELR
jgi:DNA mismatch repair protein MutS2